MIAGSAQAEQQVRFNHRSGQRQHAEVMHDAILELAHVWLAQFIVQFRLSEQHDLQQLAVAQLQVI